MREPKSLPRKVAAKITRAIKRMPPALLGISMVLSLWLASTIFSHVQGAAGLPEMAQKTAAQPSELWQEISRDAVAGRVAQGVPANARVLRLSQAALLNVLSRAPMELKTALKESPAILELPMPEGALLRFRIVESPIMEPG